MKAYAQEQGVNPHRLDSLKRSIENNRRNIKAHQDSILKLQDSLMRATQNSIEKNNKENLVLKNNETRAGKQKHYKLYLVLGFASLFSIYLIIVLLRRKSKSPPPSPGHR
ncbi:MAG: hypothetical protein ACXWV0_04215 [Flavisolibacter sp.]